MIVPQYYWPPGFYPAVPHCVVQTATGERTVHRFIGDDGRPIVGTIRVRRVLDPASGDLLDVQMLTATTPDLVRAPLVDAFGVRPNATDLRLLRATNAGASDCAIGVVTAIESR